MEELMKLPFVKAFLLMIANTLDFKGRTKRSDFWWATLAVIIIAFVVGFICAFLGTIGDLISWLVRIVLFVPQLSMGVRRLHDTGKSGLWWLIGITGIGSIVLIIWWAQQGQAGDNQYGSDPESNYGY
jgi:uncharacterized membrane protein YhaH (DUF805 family)